MSQRPLERSLMKICERMGQGGDVQHVLYHTRSAATVTLGFHAILPASLSLWSYFLDVMGRKDEPAPSHHGA